MKKCLLCDTRLKFVKFKCKDGHVCKECYGKVSLNFTQTITAKTKAELLAIYNAPEEEVATTVDFTISRKINQLILFDDQQQLICLPNHPKYSAVQRQPEFYPFAAVKNCFIDETKAVKKVDKQAVELGTLKVVIELKDHEIITRELLLIPKPIKTTSMPYKTMQTLAQKIVQEVEQAGVGVMVS